MCHQSVGLIQDAIERCGISTVSLTVRPEITVHVNVPRAAYVRFPTGMIMGEAGAPAQHVTVLKAGLECLTRFTKPGTVEELPFRWRRMGV